MNLFTETDAQREPTFEEALRAWVFRWIPRVQQKVAQLELDEILKRFGGTK